MFIPTADALDQHAAEHMMGTISVKGNGGSLSDHGIASVGPDDQARRGGMGHAVQLIGHRGLRPGDNRQDIDPAKGLSPTPDRLVKEGLTMFRVSNTQGARNIRQKHAQRQGGRFGHLRLSGLVIGNVMGQVVAARPHQKVIKTQPLYLCHAPRGDPFAAHLIFKLFGPFKNKNPMASAGHDNRHRRAADPAANHDEIILIHGFVPVLLWSPTALDRPDGA